MSNKNENMVLEDVKVEEKRKYNKKSTSEQRAAVESQITTLESKIVDYQERIGVLKEKLKKIDENEARLAKAEEEKQKQELVAGLSMAELLAMVEASKK